MAKSIMADPTVNRIVTDSGKRAAKAKKKATTAMFVAPAVISTDLALKQKAANRAVEFFNSEEPELAKMERVFNKKFKFMKEHIDNYGTGPDWVAKRKREYRDLWINDNMLNQGLSGLTAKEINMIAEKDMQDDIQAYQQQYDLAFDEGFADYETLKEAKEVMFQPYADNLSKHRKKMVSRAGLIPSAINLVMGKEEPGVSEELQAIQAFKDDVFANSVKWNEATQAYEQAVSNNRLSNIFTTPPVDFKLSEVIDKHSDFRAGFISGDTKRPYNSGGDAIKIEYVDPSNPSETKTIEPSTFTALMSPTDSRIYWTQVTSISSAMQYHYEKTKGAEGIFDKRYWIEAAIKLVNNEAGGREATSPTDPNKNLKIIDTSNPTSMLDIPGAFGATTRVLSDKVGITYTPISEQRLRDITIGSMLEAGQLFDLSTEEQANFDRETTTVANALEESGIGSEISDEDVQLMTGMKTFLMESDDQGNFVNSIQDKKAREDYFKYINTFPDSPQKDELLFIYEERVKALNSLESIQTNISNNTTQDDTKETVLEEDIKAEVNSIVDDPEFIERYDEKTRNNPSLLRSAIMTDINKGLITVDNKIPKFTLLSRIMEAITLKTPDIETMAETNPRIKSILERR